MYKIRHIHLVRAVLQSSHLGDYPLSLLWSSPSGAVYKPYTNAHTPLHYLISEFVFTALKLKPMERTVKRVHVLTTLRMSSLMSYTLLKTNNEPLNDKANDPFPKVGRTYW